MSATVTDENPTGNDPKQPNRRAGRTDRSGAAADRGRGRPAKEIAVDRSAPGHEAPDGDELKITADTAADQSSGRLISMVPGVDVASMVRSRMGSKVGGVAPFVPPARRMNRRLRMREWNRRGFVPLSPGKQKLRHRILPRTVIGIAFMLMCFGMGGAFAGASFYAYYDDRLAENERTVARFVEGFDQQFTDAAGLLDEMRTDAIGEIRGELTPLEEYVADADGVISLPGSAGPSVWLLETRDEAGEIVNGSAFAVVGHEGGTALVTSYSLITASVVAPSPAMDLLKGDERIPAQLWSWDEERDLALVVVDREIPTLDLAGENDQIGSVGARVFALSGFGGQGATASPGVLLDHSRVGLQHTAPVGTLFRGGPLLTGEGKVVGVASNDYQPFGLDSGDVRQAPDIRGLCERLLACAEFRRDIIVGDEEAPVDGSGSDTIEVEVAAEAGEAPARGEGPVRTEAEIDAQAAELDLDDQIDPEAEAEAAAQIEAEAEAEAEVLAEARAETEAAPRPPAENSAQATAGDSAENGDGAEGGAGQDG